MVSSVSGCRGGVRVGYGNGRGCSSVPSRKRKDCSSVPVSAVQARPGAHTQGGLWIRGAVTRDPVGPQRLSPERLRGQEVHLCARGSSQVAWLGGAGEP